MHETAFPISIATDPDLLYIFSGREASTGNTSAARRLKMSGKPWFPFWPKSFQSHHLPHYGTLKTVTKRIDGKYTYQVVVGKQLEEVSSLKFKHK